MDASSLARVRTSSRQAVPTGSPIGNSGVVRWLVACSGAGGAIVSVMPYLPFLPMGSVWQTGWSRRSARRSPPGRAAGHTGAARGDIRAAGVKGPPGPVGGGRDPDPAGPADLAGRDRPARAQLHRPRVQGGAVGPAGQAEGLAEAGRAAGQVAGAAGRAPGPHALDPADRLAGPEQHRLGDPLGAADHVGAPVHPVGEVEVEVAGRAEHDRVAGGGAAVGVAGRVEPGPVVGLGLDQPGGADPLRGPVDQEPPQQVGGHLQQRAQVELDRQRLEGTGRERLGGGVDSRPHLFRLWATLPFGGPRNRRMGVRRAYVGILVHRPGRPLARKRRSSSRGRVLMTRSGVVQPRPAVATAKRMLARWPGPWLSAPKASMTPNWWARRTCSSPRSRREGEPLTSRAVPVAAAARYSASRSTSPAARLPMRRPVGWPMTLTAGCRQAATSRAVSSSRGWSRRSWTLATSTSKPSRNWSS